MVIYTEWIAVAFTLAGEVVLSQGDPSLVLYAYGLFFIGNLFWLRVGIQRKMPALVVLNSVFIMLNFIGIYNWW